MSSSSRLLYLLLALECALPLPFSLLLSSPLPLGVRLSADLTVLGFHTQSGAKMQVEASGWVREGDRLLSVNGIALTGLPLTEVQRILSSAALPRNLTFDTYTPDDNRTHTMHMQQQHEQASQQHKVPKLPRLLKQGRVELAEGDISMDFAPQFLQADFGGPIICDKTTHNIVNSHAKFGCMAHKDEDSVAGALVIAHRGGCTFSDKAILAEQAGAAGLIIINADDLLEEMEGDVAQTFDIHIPVVMVGATMGARLMRAAINATDGKVPALMPKRIPHGRLTLNALTCDEMSLARFAAKPIASSGNEIDEGDGSGMTGGSVIMQDRSGAQGEFLRATFGAVSVDVHRAFVVVEAQPDRSACDAISAADVYRRLKASNATLPYTIALLASRGVCTYQQKLDSLRRMLLQFAENDIPLSPGALLLIVNTEPGLKVMEHPPHEAPLQSPHMAIMVTSFFGSQLRSRMHSDDGSLPSITLKPGPKVPQLWADLAAFSDKAAWGGKDARKTFTALSKLHHPDTAGGSIERFETLVSYYQMAVSGIQRSVEVPVEP